MKTRQRRSQGLAERSGLNAAPMAELQSHGKLRPESMLVTFLNIAMFSIDELLHLAQPYSMLRNARGMDPVLPHDGKELHSGPRPTGFFPLSAGRVARPLGRVGYLVRCTMRPGVRPGYARSHCTVPLGAPRKAWRSEGASSRADHRKIRLGPGGRSGASQPCGALPGGFGITNDHRG